MAAAPAPEAGKAFQEAMSTMPAPPSVPVVVSEKERRLIDWMQAHPHEVIRQRQDMLTLLTKRRCSYGSEGGGPFPTTLTPLFLELAAVEKIARVSEVFDRIIDKVIHAYVGGDEHVRSYFPYTDIPEEWIHWDPGYEKPTQLNRHDALFDGKNLKFIEFNTDNPGGRGWVDTLEDIYRAYPLYQELIAAYETERGDRPMLRAGMKAMLDCYREAGGRSQSPRIGLVSYKEYLGSSDIEIVRDYLVEHGVEAHFMDPRDFEYRKGKLYSGNLPFDILNLGIRFVFFKRFPREVRDFLEAIRDRAVVALNPLRAIIGSHKEILSFVSNTYNHHYFTEDEAAVIREHLPWTRKLDETITMSPEGTDIALQDFIIRERDRMVLKPCGGAGGQGVTVGHTTSEGEWRDTVKHTMGCPWWIVQEAVPIPEYEMPVLKDGKIVLEKKFMNVNPYVYGGRYVGCLGRVSERNVINVSAGGGLIPCFPLREK